MTDADNIVEETATEREAFPQGGDHPGPGEEGYVRCEDGHLGPIMTIDEGVPFDGPKGQFNPYCVSCINLWVIKQAGLKPMRFFIRKRSYQAVPPKLIVPGRELPGEFERRG